MTTIKELLTRLAETNQFLQLVNVIDAIDSCLTEPITLNLREIRSRSLSCEIVDRTERYSLGVARGLLLHEIGKLP